MNQANLTFAGERSSTVLLKISGPRERFELRIRNSSFGSLAEWVLMRNEDGSYKDRQIQHRWEDWLACTAESTATIADLQSKLRAALAQNQTSQRRAIDTHAAVQSSSLIHQGLSEMKEALGSIQQLCKRHPR
jgi:hypothetical protein